jgi:hypothetical protein
MTPILTFTRGEFDRELVRLGDVVVGEVSVHNGSKVRATFSLRLPECRAAFRPATSFEEARKTIQAEIEQWFVRAGVFYPEQPIEVHVIDSNAREARSA